MIFIAVGSSLISFVVVVVVLLMWTVNELHLWQKALTVTSIFAFFRFQRNTPLTICILSEEVILTRSPPLMKTQTPEKDSSHILFMGLDVSLSYRTKNSY